MSMELIVKEFSELSTDELYDILQLRSSVFVVEQKCAYQDLDDKDRDSIHVWMYDRGIRAYLRISDIEDDSVHIGRVIATDRRIGLGSSIVSEGIRIAREDLGADVIKVEAQTYAEGLYLKHGFIRKSEEYLLDGIPHVRMELRCDNIPR